MRSKMLCAALALAGVAGAVAGAAAETRVGRGGGIEVAGRKVSCSNVTTRLDHSFPNLGAAAPDERLMILNPRLLNRYPRTVQLFVYYHECGHHRVGASEHRADCWAVNQGVRDGWLDRNGLAQVCRSFENAAPTDTHPSGRSRCANIDRCFATAELEVARERPAQRRRADAPIAPPAPRLVAGPRLLRSSAFR